MKQQHAPDVEDRCRGEKNHSVGRVYLEHVLSVSEFMVALEIACRGTEARLLDETEFGRNPVTDQPRPSFRWQVNLTEGKTLGVIPDRTFGLEIQAAGAPPARSFFFLEVDRGTMPIMRKDFSQSSIYRKFLAYQKTWASAIHREQFGFHRFRVLTVTTSPGRAESMIRACRTLERGRGLFLFADMSIVAKSGSLLRARWQTTNPSVTSSLLT